MSFLFRCVNSSTSTTIPAFNGNQRVAKADKPLKCIDTERNALRDFKAMILQDPYDCVSTWGTEEECCNWSGVTCNDQMGHVTGIHLSYCGLEGEISPSLLNLTSLTRLNLGWNSFHGSIPESIGNLTKLRYLSLSSNSFNGTIPLSIGSLTVLTHLGLNWNSFHGSIPMSVGSLTELRYLDLSYNSFNGTIPVSIVSLIELRYLDLSHNSFNGTIPKSIGSLTELRYLDVSDNSFGGSIPICIGSLTELRYLSLSHNSFSGNIPPEYGNLVNLECLYLKGIGRCSVENISWLSRLSHLVELNMNGISLAKANHWVNAILSLQNLTELHLKGCDLSKVMHPLSSSSVNFSSYSSSNIGWLYLSNNSLNSSMYHWLYPLTSHNLYSLDLSRNKLDEIPKYFGNLCSLIVLDFSNNSALVTYSDFQKILSSGCTSDTLEFVYASSSQFTGSIADDIQQFSSLNVLELDHNKLNGTVSDKIWELPMLEKLDISSNSFGDDIIEKIGKSRLMHIDLSSNNFSGKAPDLLSSFNGSLEALDLSSNNFYGPITNVSSSLNLLNLSKNKFNGGISFLCQIVDGSLVYLDLSHNSFSGKIPDCLWNLTELSVLNLAHNNLSGRLPASVEYLIHLEVLYLYSNNFSEELPLSLRKCSMLTILDLGANKFSGTVPVWIGENLSRLYVLNLGANNFFGPIPLQICQLENLQILDLSMNNLNETIPSCVNNLTSMVQEEFLSTHNVREFPISVNGPRTTIWDYVDHAMIQWQGIIREFTSNLRLLKIIDLSSNNLTGHIPNELIDLRGLLALNLSKNALYGEIPQNIGQVKELLSLDLSRNHFLGGIPLSISELTSLNYLDLSYNNLSGKIPSGNQLRTFEASSYIGNAGLCGPPLPRYCPGDEELHIPSPVGEREGDTDEHDIWFYIGGATGFPTGFWIVCSILLVNRRRRHAFFHFMDISEGWVYMKVIDLKTKFQRASHE